MNIIKASDELFNHLKNYDEVIGSGVKKQNGINYIIIYLSKETKRVINKIPKEYMGIKVVTKKTEEFTMH